jgi:hypothetical protein
MQGGTAPQKPAAVKPQPTPAKPSHATAKKKTAPTNQKPAAQKKKIKLTPLSFTAKLIIIIICLLIAITVAVISLFSSPDKFESFSPVVQRASEAKAALLCLRQVLL